MAVDTTYESDDYFDLDKYRQAAGVAYEFSKKKMEDAGEQERKTIGKGGEETRATDAQNKSSLKETKKEIVNRPNQLIDIDLFNNWVDNLDSATQESFCSFVSDNNSIIEAYLYSRFLGYEGSIAPCDLWIKANYKKPDHRKEVVI